MPTKSRSLFNYARSFFFYLGVVWAAVIALLATPVVQRQYASYIARSLWISTDSTRSATFKHALQYPFSTNYTAPEKYGLARKFPCRYKFRSSSSQCCTGCHNVTDATFVYMQLGRLSTSTLRPRIMKHSELGLCCQILSTRRFLKIPSLFNLMKLFRTLSRTPPPSFSFTELGVHAQTTSVSRRTKLSLPDCHVTF